MAYYHTDPFFTHVSNLPPLFQYSNLSFFNHHMPVYVIRGNTKSNQKGKKKSVDVISDRNDPD